MFYRLKGRKLSKMGQKRPSFFGRDVWSLDGKYIAYGVKAEGKVSMVRKPSDGSSAEETLLTQGPEIVPSPVIDWSPDGRYLTYPVFNTNQGRRENWILPPLARANRFSALRWVAAVSMMGTFRGRRLV
jgi:hypothetical protein